MFPGINPNQRENLRLILIDDFSLGDLKVLAFNLGSGYELYTYVSRADLADALITGFEQEARLRCLVEEVLRHQERQSLRRLLAQLPVCQPSRLLQVLYPTNRITDLPAVTDELAQFFGVPADRVVPVGAASGTMQLLFSLPGEAVTDELIGEALNIPGATVQFSALEALDLLSPLEQSAWQYLAINYPPEVTGNELEPVFSWWDAIVEILTGYLTLLLSETFSLVDLKSLAFALGGDSDLYSYTDKAAIIDQLIPPAAPLNRLVCLAQEIINRYEDPNLSSLIPNLPACETRIMVQVSYYYDLITDLPTLLVKIAELFGIAADQVSLVGAAKEGTRLLISLPEDAASDEAIALASNLAAKMYEFISLRRFDQLSRLERTAWQYIAIYHPPQLLDDTLQPEVSWQAATAVILSAPSTLIETIRMEVKAAVEPVINQIKSLLTFILRRDLLGPPRRRALIAAVFLFLWLIFVIREGIPDQATPGYITGTLRFFRLESVAAFLVRVAGEEGSLRNTLIRMGTAFISADVLRHLPWIFLGWWFALRVATRYLDDLFELNSQERARNYLRGSVLGKPYEFLLIDGPKPDPNNLLIRIGGPGIVNTPLEWTALFESINHVPNVLAPGISFINGFERLREVISIKDQLSVQNNVRDFSKDGVPVTAQDVQILFSIDRAGEGPRFPERPYPYDDEAIKNIIYEQRITEIRDIGWTERLTDIVNSEIRRFVSTHQLNEFLAEPPDEGTFTELTIRRAMTQSFYDPGAIIQAIIAELSNSLIWINVGTWMIPDEIVPSEHIRAWQLSWYNLYRQTPEYLGNIYQTAFGRAIRLLLRELIEVQDRYPPESPLFAPFFLRKYRSHVLSQALPPEYDSLKHYLEENTVYIA